MLQAMQMFELQLFAILILGVIRAMGRSKPMDTTWINSAAVQYNTGRSGYAEKGGNSFRVNGGKKRLKIYQRRYKRLRLNEGIG